MVQNLHGLAACAERGSRKGQNGLYASSSPSGGTCITSGICITMHHLGVHAHHDCVPLPSPSSRGQHFSIQP